MSKHHTNGSIGLKLGLIKNEGAGAKLLRLTFPDPSLCLGHLLGQKVNFHLTSTDNKELIKAYTPMTSHIKTAYVDFLVPTDSEDPCD